MTNEEMRMEHAAGQLPAFPVPGHSTGMNQLEYLMAHAPEAPEWFVREYKASGFNDEQIYFQWRWYYAKKMIRQSLK